MKTIATFLMSFALAVLSVHVYADAQEDAEKFVKKAAMSNALEVRSSKVALERAQRADVKEYAQQMVTQHTKAAEELKAAIAQARLNFQVPEELDNDRQDKLRELAKADPKDFDEDYIDLQQDLHEETVALFEDYAEDGEVPALRDFAIKKLSELRMHEESIKRIEDAQYPVIAMPAGVIHSGPVGAAALYDP